MLVLARCDLSTIFAWFFEAPYRGGFALEKRLFIGGLWRALADRRGADQVADRLSGEVVDLDAVALEQGAALKEAGLGQGLGQPADCRRAQAGDLGHPTLTEGVIAGLLLDSEEVAGGLGIKAMLSAESLKSLKLLEFALSASDLLTDVHGCSL